MTAVQPIEQSIEEEPKESFSVRPRSATKGGMRIIFSEEKIIGASDALEIIFPNRKTQTAARIFVKWLKDKGGQSSKTAVSLFAEEMQGGRLDGNGRPFRYSKRNFYMTVLKTLISMGFIRRNVPVWDERGKRTLYVYVRNIFDIPQKPPSVGFWRLSYYVAKKWNKIFLE
jgi:hypothetical protein